MWILISAVVTASLLGSMHCVGMCGPLAMWASGVSDQQRSLVAIRTTAYHVGRLITYVIAGGIAGAIGSVVDTGGQFIGVQVAAARVVGAIMIGVGLSKLWTLWRGHSTAAKEIKPSRIGGVLVKLRPHLFRLPPVGRALATGLLTTLLPCGWLYLFALIAAGTASPILGPIVMAAFWIGTVPALTALIAGSTLLGKKFTTAVPVAAAGLLIATGGFTASGRGFANIDALASLRSSMAVDPQTASQVPLQTTLVKQAKQAGDKPLPCCCVGEKKCDGEVVQP
jgi:uncharacterized protein